MLGLSKIETVLQYFIWFFYLNATSTEIQAILTKSLVPRSPTVVVFNNSIPLYHLIDACFYFILLDMQLFRLSNFSSLLILCENALKIVLLNYG